MHGQIRGSVKLLVSSPSFRRWGRYEVESINNSNSNEVKFLKEFGDVVAFNGANHILPINGND